MDAMVGQSSVGSEIPGASGFVVSFQEKLTPTLFHDLSTDHNMGWVRSDSWLTYLNLDAPEPRVTYDLEVSPSGVIRLAPYGTAPMAVVDGQWSHEPPAWLPRLPLGAPQILLTIDNLAEHWRWSVLACSREKTSQGKRAGLTYTMGDTDSHER
jgi:hypothetical protein